MKKKPQTIIKPSLLSALAGLVLAACSGEGFEDEQASDPEFDVIGQSILNGDQSNMDSVVKVHRTTATGTSLCTGTLLRNDIVLTAKHCVGTADGTFRRHWIRTTSGETSDISSRAQIAEHPSADVAVMRLDNPVTFGGSDFYAMTALFEGSVSSLTGDAVLCVGYGIKTCGGSDSGTQRQATLTIESASSTSLVYEPNARDQLLSSGDSGGPCFQGGKVVGTTRTASCSEAKQVPMPTYAQWIRDEIAGLIESQTFANPSVKTSRALLTPIRWFANSTEHKRQFCIEKGFADAAAEESRASRPAGTVFAMWDSAAGEWEADTLNLPVGVYTQIVCRN